MPSAITPNTSGIGRRVGIVLSRFNPGIVDLMLARRCAA
jgi:6,7-dimethyl-8-ribityllumazine synthase